MAEFGAHLDARPSAELPSIFEVLAQENLNAALRPAFGHVIKVATELNIGVLLPVRQWKDEIFTALELGLQQFCLKVCGASFAESFYDLLRFPVRSDGHIPKAGYQLPPRFHRRSLLCLVLVPYLKLKADAHFERLRQEDAEGTANLSNDAKRKARNILLKLYPVFHFLWEILVLYYQVGYALGKQTFPGPLYALAGTQLVMAEVKEDSPEEGADVNLWNLLQCTRLPYLPAALASYLRNNFRFLMSTALSLGTFFLQFLDWWYSNDTLARSTFVSAIPPPKQDHNDGFIKQLNMCPICSRSRTNETALSTSGYVFCYPCIYKYVKAHNQCPVTRLPTSADNLVRLYSDTATV